MVNNSTNAKNPSLYIQLFTCDIEYDNNRTEQWILNRITEESNIQRELENIHKETEMLTPSSTKYDVSSKNSKAKKFLHNYNIEVLNPIKNAHIKIEKILSGVLHLLTLYIYTPERGWTKEEYTQEVTPEPQYESSIKPNVQHPIQEPIVKEFTAQVKNENEIVTLDDKLSSLVEDLQQFSLDPSTFGDQAQNQKEKDQLNELMSFFKQISQNADFNPEKWLCGHSKTKEFDLAWFEHVSRRKTFVYMVKEVNNKYLTERLQRAESGNLIGYTIVTPQTIVRNFFKNSLLKLFIEWKKENGYVVTEKELNAAKKIK
ncbi:MAG: hypothetical protein KAR35_03080 [Candidatus Heimdallarchaeota archaeon]|nr:hypothetical protein [Candidatus Heimdallarchaeota archaeon]MCK5048339.1 hypothetical protein [Candidatus Heimdallarchaeota archaeon]